MVYNRVAGKLDKLSDQLSRYYKKDKTGVGGVDENMDLVENW
ncbi:MAG: hypothetical protein R2685_13255 [Candidatus Nitrosocosmicus sp.]|jgi:hypothetical protein